MDRANQTAVIDNPTTVMPQPAAINLTYTAVIMNLPTGLTQTKNKAKMETVV